MRQAFGHGARPPGADTFDGEFCRHVRRYIVLPAALAVLEMERGAGQGPGGVAIGTQRLQRLQQLQRLGSGQGAGGTR